MTEKMLKNDCINRLSGPGPIIKMVSNIKLLKALIMSCSWWFFRHTCWAEFSYKVLFISWNFPGGWFAVHINLNILFIMSHVFLYSDIHVFSSVPIFLKLNVFCQVSLNMWNQCSFTCGIIIFELDYIKKWQVDRGISRLSH